MQRGVFPIGFVQDALSGFLRKGISISWSWRFWGCPKVSNLKYFQDYEVAGLVNPLPLMLDQARGIAGVPFRLTFTTGGEHCGNSAHYKGLAVDIGLGDKTPGFDRDTIRWAILKGVFGAGFKRVEICELHIHVDIGEPPDYVSPTSWIGKDA